MLRKIFGPELEEVTNERRNLRNMDFRNLCVPQNIVRLPNKVGGECDIWHMLGKQERLDRILIRILRILWRLRSRRELIKLHLERLVRSM